MSTGTREQLTTESVLAAIPPFSPAVLKVMDLLAQSEIEMAVLARTISSDTTLSAEILKLANSALFGAAARIDTIQKATVTLGHSWIQHVTLRAGALGYVRGAAQTPELTRCWRHTLATAALCRLLARAAGMSAERAYTMGLLHDIGRLGLLSAFSAEYSEAVQSAERGELRLSEAEKAAFGVDHGEVGRRLLESWNLPEDFARAAAGHHQAPSGTSFDLLNVVQIACRLADGLGYWLVQPDTPWTLEMALEALPESARGHFPSETQPLIEAVEEVIAENGSLEMEAAKPAPAAETSAQPAPQPEPVAAPEFRLSERGSGPWKIILLLVVAIPLIWLIALQVFR